MTYLWQCLLDLECYTRAQQDDIIADDDCACPACSHLREIKISHFREIKISEQEQIEIT